MGWYSTILLKITLKDSAHAVDLDALKATLQDETFLEMIHARHAELRNANPNLICDVTVSQVNDLIHIDAVYKYGETPELRLLCMACKELFQDKAILISGGFCTPDEIIFDPRAPTEDELNAGTVLASPENAAYVAADYATLVQRIQDLRDDWSELAEAIENLDRVALDLPDHAQGTPFEKLCQANKAIRNVVHVMDSLRTKLPKQRAKPILTCVNCV